MARKPADMDEVERKAIGILRGAFEQSGMTQGELADKVGVARTTILKTFAGSRATYISEFEGIAKALGLSPWRVMRQAEDALEAESNVLRFPATSRQENQREADAMIAEQRYAASQLQDGEEDAPQYPEWD
jgi:transcriptional regulator with XRE-family HTH domain